MKRLIISWVTIAAFLAYAAGTLALESRSNRGSAEREHGHLGTIGVVSARYAPTFKFHVHAGENGHSVKKGTVGTLRGFWNGCGNFVNATADSGLGIVAFFGCFYLTPFVAAGGATFAALRAKSMRGGEIGKTKSAMKPVLTERGIQVILQDHILRQVRDRRDHRFVPRWDLGPEKSGQTPNYQGLAGQGIDTILEVSVTHVAAMGEGTNPSLALRVVALARLVHARDSTELYNHKHVFETDRRELREWTLGDPALRRISEQACADLAQRIIEGAFPLRTSATEIVAANAGI